MTNLSYTNNSSADYNLRILWSLARYIEDTHGIARLERISTCAQINVRHLDGRNVWVSQHQFETFLDEARKLFPDDSSFQNACTYRIREAFGPMRYVLWATTPRVVFKKSIETHRLVSNIGVPQILSEGPNHMTARFDPTPGQPISRLNCIARQALSRSLPAMWGLPAAVMHEYACVANGDEACIYHAYWSEKPRWFSWALGALMSGMIALLGYSWMRVPYWVCIALVFVGGFVGYMFDCYRTRKRNDRIAIEANEAICQLAYGETHMSQELATLHQKQNQWNKHVRAEVAEQTSKISQLIEHVRLHNERNARERSFELTTYPSVSQKREIPQEKISNVIPFTKKKRDNP